MLRGTTLKFLMDNFSIFAEFIRFTKIILTEYYLYFMENKIKLSFLSLTGDKHEIIFRPPLHTDKIRKLSLTVLNIASFSLSKN